MNYMEVLFREKKEASTGVPASHLFKLLHSFFQVLGHGKMALQGADVI